MSNVKCAVCGSSIYAEQVPPVLFRGVTLHFKCRHCLEYFASDSERFMRKGPAVNPCLERGGNNASVK